MNKNLYAATHQRGATISTLNPKPTIAAYIYDKQQLDMVNNLISQGFLPTHTSVGVGKLDRAKWRIEDYKGKFGTGAKTVSYSPHSSNFNHITYFINQQAS